MVRVQELNMIYANHILNWPFLAARRLLRLQLGRSKLIKQALAERLNNHPLSSHNSARFNNLDSDPKNNPHDAVMVGGETSDAEDIDLALFQRGEADGEPSQSETRPGQVDPGELGILSPLPFF
jgi:hypothetical protein